MSEDLLERLGKPADTLVHLDFETFYSADYSLSKLTTEAYVRDERFEVIGVGVRVGDAPTVWLEEWEFREWVKRVDWSRVALNAHHAQFDAFILSEHYDVRPAFIFDTMSMGRVLYGGGSLERLAVKLNVGVKGDELSKTKGKRRADFTQREWVTFGKYCKTDVDLTAGCLRAMLPSFPELELWIVDLTVRFFTEPVFEADLTVLRSALAEERAKKRALLQRIAEQEGIPVTDEPLESARAVLSSSDKFAALLHRFGEVAPLKPNKKGENIYAFAKTDPGMVALLEHPRDEIRFLAEARLAVKSTIVETRTERLIGIGQRGAVPFYLKAYGAHTHRWSGGDKMNPQNFNRGGALRDAILAPAGHTLVVADSSQIEARVLAWFAGELGLLETFRRNDTAQHAGIAAAKAQGVKIKDYWKANGGEPDFYSDVGSSFFLKRISKAETPIERQLSKNMILGLGFGMGWGKFAGELLKGMLGSDPVQFGPAEAEKFNVDVDAFEVRPHGMNGPPCGSKVEDLRTFGIRLSYADLLVHCAVADHFVRLYRARNPRIVATWRACEDVLRVMEIPEGDPHAVRLKFGCLRVVRHGLVKPNGLTMRYPGLRRGPGGFSYLGGKSGREHAKVYGGLLTENIVQSLARDVVAEQVLRVRADGHRVATTTHDEAVGVVREERGAEVLESMLAHMRVPPAWCATLPLNAAGGHGRSYGAVK